MAEKGHAFDTAAQRRKQVAGNRAPLPKPTGENRPRCNRP